MTFREGQGVLRRALIECTQRGFTVSRLSSGVLHELGPAVADGGAVSVLLQIQGRGSVTDFAAALSEIDGVLTVSAGDANTSSE